MTSVEAQTPKPLPRRTRPIPSWLATLAGSASWIVATHILTVLQYLPTNS